MTTRKINYVPFVCTKNIEKLPIIENKLKMNCKVNYKNELKINMKFQKVLRQMKNEEAMKRNVRGEKLARKSSKQREIEKGCEKKQPFYNLILCTDPCFLSAFHRCSLAVFQPPQHDVRHTCDASTLWLRFRALPRVY